MEVQQNRSSLIKAVVAIVVLCLIGGAGYYAYHAHKTTKAVGATTPPTTAQPNEEPQYGPITLGAKLATVTVNKQWQIVTRATPCKLVTDGTDPSVATPTCLSELTLNPAGASTELAARPATTVGQIILIATPTKSLQAILTQIAGPCGSPAAGVTGKSGSYQVSGGYEATYCTTSSSISGDVVDSYAVRKGNNVVYLSFDAKLGPAFSGRSATANLPAIDLSQYTPTFEAMVKSVRFQ